MAGLRGPFASLLSKRPLLDEKHDMYMVRLLGALRIKTPVEFFSPCTMGSSVSS